jgi:uncharacterized integral membrane protein
MVDSQANSQPISQSIPLAEPEIYQGRFGEFTITASDRREVIIYRAGLAIAALSFAIGAWLVLWQGSNPLVLIALTPLYALFSIALGVSLFYIHIYMAVLHRVLQIFWGIGTAAAIVVALSSTKPLALAVYSQPLTILGIGFTFAALTGIFFKEAVCFNRLETKILTPLVPILLLGHMTGLLSPEWKQLSLMLWAILFLIFGFRKVIQSIPPDIGDKSVFAYLKQQRQGVEN